MLTLIGIAAVIAALVYAYKWYVGKEVAAAALVAPVEADAVAVEAKVQSEVAVAEKVAEGVVAEIKAKL